MLTMLKSSSPSLVSRLPIKQISSRAAVHCFGGECAKLSHARLQQKLKKQQAKTTDTRTAEKQKSTRSKQTAKKRTQKEQQK